MTEIPLDPVVPILDPVPAADPPQDDADFIPLPLPPAARVSTGGDVTFVARVAFATDPALTERVRVAAITTALAVSAQERPTDLDTTRVRSNVRRALAREVLTDPAVFAPRLQWTLACTQAATAGPDKVTDDELAAATAAVWDALAGA